MNLDLFVLSIAAAAIAGWFAWEKSLGKEWSQRWLMVFSLVVVAEGGIWVTGKFATAFHERYRDAHSQETVRRAMTRLAPVIAPIMEREDPKAWRSAIAEAGDIAAKSWGEFPSPSDSRRIVAVLRTLINSFLGAISMADGRTILAIAHQEIAMDEVLQQEDLGMCASRRNPNWISGKLSPKSLKAVQQYAALIADAYEQGKGRKVPLINRVVAGQLLRQAVDWKSSPLSPSDAAYLFSRRLGDLARACRVRLQFERNVLAIPERIALLRWIYAHSIR